MKDALLRIIGKKLPKILMEEESPDGDIIELRPWFLTNGINADILSSLKNIEKIQSFLMNFQDEFDYLFQNTRSDLKALLEEIQSAFMFIDQKKIKVLLLLENRDIAKSIAVTPYEHDMCKRWVIPDFIDDYVLEIEMPDETREIERKSYNFVMTDNMNPYYCLALSEEGFLPHEIVYVKNGFEGLLCNQFKQIFFRQYKFIRSQMDLFIERIQECLNDISFSTEDQIDKVDRAGKSLADISMSMNERFISFCESAADKLAATSKDLFDSKHKYDFSKVRAKLDNRLEDANDEIFDDLVNSFCLKLSDEVEASVDALTVKFGNDALVLEINNACDETTNLIKNHLSYNEPVGLEQPPTLSLDNAATNLMSFGSFLKSTFFSINNLILIVIWCAVFWVYRKVASVASAPIASHFDFIQTTVLILIILLLAIIAIFLLLNFKDYKAILQIRNLRLSASDMSSWAKRNGTDYFRGVIHELKAKAMNEAREPLIRCESLIREESKRYRALQKELLNNIKELGHSFQSIHEKMEGNESSNSF